MADIFNKKTRSRVMACVKNKNTAPEIAIRKALFARGLRYRLHDENLPGRPDLIFKKWGAIIFIHGCFWHRHDCKYAALPATNKKFWTQKLTGNALRDKEAVKKLTQAGWRVKIVWSCMLKNRKEIDSEKTVDAIVEWILLSGREKNKNKKSCSIQSGMQARVHIN